MSCCLLSAGAWGCLRISCSATELPRRFKGLRARRGRFYPLVLAVCSRKRSRRGREAVEARDGGPQVLRAQVGVPRASRGDSPRCAAGRGTGSPPASRRRRPSRTPAQIHDGGEADRLLDHLIRPLQERRRDRQAQGLRGLEVDYQVELCGLLNREISRFRALEDLVHVGGGVPIDIDRVGTVAQKAAVCYELSGADTGS